MSSLDLLRTQMQDAQPVLKALDMELERIKFDPTAPASVDEAIVRVSTVIDAHLGEFRANPILGPMAEQLKSQYVDGIHDHVALAAAAE
ncbi:hypothetical protein [Pseudomonas sp. DSP3-2-2]|uniref:hypothetical protein n=1 Tax=unclassified Pseudomonas TaxID=196821 RepID=UPI003CFA94C9